MSTKNIVATGVGVFAGFRVAHMFLPIDLADTQLGPINLYDLATAMLVTGGVIAAHMVI